MPLSFFSGCSPRRTSLKSFWSPTSYRGGFPVSPTSTSWTQAGWSTMRLNSNTTNPRESCRSHKERAQSCRITFHFRHQQHTQVVNLYFWLTDFWLKPEVPTAPSLGLINMLQKLKELRKPIFSLDYQFIAKDFKRGTSTARGRKAQGKVWAQRAQSFHHLSKCAASWVSSCSPILKLSERWPLGFCGGFITQAGLVKSFVFGDELKLQPFSSPPDAFQKSPY